MCFLEPESQRARVRSSIRVQTAARQMESKNVQNMIYQTHNSYNDILNYNWESNYSCVSLSQPVGACVRKTQPHKHVRIQTSMNYWKLPKCTCHFNSPLIGAVGPLLVDQTGMVPVGVTTPSRYARSKGTASRDSISPQGNTVNYGVQPRGLYGRNSQEVKPSRPGSSHFYGEAQPGTV